MDVHDPQFRERLRAHLERHSARRPARAAFEQAATVVAYALALWAVREALARAPSGLEWVAATTLAVLALALVQVRAFLVHHDLCHFAAYRSKRLNLALAQLFGALCSTSPSVWKREHDRHHRDSNNLDRSQDGQTAPWTVEAYLGAPAWQRRLYWLVNQRPVLFGLVPPLYFLGFMRVAARWYENLAFAAVVGALWWTRTLPAFGLALVPATLFGFLVFHAQHTGPRLVRRRHADWDPIENGLLGSTFLLVPRWPVVGAVLRWAFFGVEYHHVHHLYPAMPAFRQRACHEEGGALFDEVPRITFGQALQATGLTLYDEAEGRLVGFEVVAGAKSARTAA